MEPKKNLRKLMEKLPRTGRRVEGFGALFGARPRRGGVVRQRRRRCRRRRGAAAAGVDRQGPRAQCLGRFRRRPHQYRRRHRRRRRRRRRRRPRSVGAEGKVVERVGETDAGRRRRRRRRRRRQRRRRRHAQRRRIFERPERRRSSFLRYQLSLPSFIEFRHLGSVQTSFNRKPVKKHWLFCLKMVYRVFTGFCSR